MSAYAWLLFAHVASAVGLFVAFGMETVALGRLHRAAGAAEAREAAALFTAPFRIGPPAMIATLLSGIGLMRLAWLPSPWLIGAAAGLVAMGVIGAVLSLRTLRRLRAAPAPGAHRPLATSLWLRAALGVAILGLMTVKPGAVGTAAALAAAVLAAAWASSRRARDLLHTREDDARSPSAVRE